MDKVKGTSPATAGAAVTGEAWASGVWEKILPKLLATRTRVGDGLPFVSVNGRWRERGGDKHRSWWTNGFWPGLCWLAFRETADEAWMDAARGCESRLDEALEWFEDLHHDVGFVWTLSSVASYRLTANEDSRRKALHAATLLAGRFNQAGRFIRAWNGRKQAGWAIVDSLMNLPLLHWASETTGDPRFAQVALAHADTALERILRPDGSVNHIVRFDPDSGAYIDSLAGQGYAAGSSWSRGQAWALYGFALSHRHSGLAPHLEAARRVADYFISQLGESGLPRVDFRAPPLPMDLDSSAGAIAASGLLEIASLVPVAEAPAYRSAAARLLAALDFGCGSWALPDEEGLLLHGAHAWHHDDKIHPNDTPIIYGDYFFTEAVLRLKSPSGSLW